MHIHPTRGELTFKIVYCGPGLAGKTTSLQFLHSRLPSGRASGLISVDSHSQRTLHFDFGSIELGEIQGIPTRLEFYTVPGQAYYAASRRHVLNGVDGIIFVVDSRFAVIHENIFAMNELLADLRHHGLPNDLPFVLQYNKRDLDDAMPVRQLDPLINSRGWPTFSSVAITGEGVVEACEALTSLLADRCSGLDLSCQLSNPPPPIQPKNWLISCHRCQSMLDVPSAVTGEQYECSVCKASLMVVDGERGITQRPPKSTESMNRLGCDGGGDGGQPKPRKQNITAIFNQEETGSSGYPVLPPESSVPAVLKARNFSLPGFDVLEVLDENAQGRRMRVRESDTGKLYRALVVAAELMQLPHFRSEADRLSRLVGSIHHPNLIRLSSLRTLECSELESLVYLVEDPTDYVTLGHVLARRRALAPPHALDIIRQIVLALEECSRHGVTHGWVRPGVILVNSNGHVLLDEIYVPTRQEFLVEAIEGASVATEHYFAPGQLRENGQIDIGANIFVTGSLLFRMITGEGFLTGRRFEEAFQRLQSGPRNLRTGQDGQDGPSRDLNNFFIRLVALDGAQRFTSYRDVLETLGHFGGGAKRQNLRIGARNIRRHNKDALVTSSQQRISPEVSVPIILNEDKAKVVSEGRVQQNEWSVNRLRFIISATLGVVLISSFVIFELLGNKPISIKAEVAKKDGSSVPSEALTATGSNSNASVSHQGIRRRIKDFTALGHWTDALQACQELPDPLAKQEMETHIAKVHNDLQRAVESMILNGDNDPLVRQKLASFVTPYCFPGDEDWKNKMLALMVGAQHERKLLDVPLKIVVSERKSRAASPAVVPSVIPVISNPKVVAGELAVGKSKDLPGPLVSSAPKAATVILPESTKAPVEDLRPIAADASSVVDPEMLALGAILASLKRNDPHQLEQILVGIPKGSSWLPDIQLLCASWPVRLQLINRVAKNSRITLRCPNPFTGESDDVTSVNASGLTFAAANGGSATMAWSLTPPDVVCQLLIAASGSPGLTENELGGAIAGLLVHDDLIDAKSILQQQRLLVTARKEIFERQIEMAQGLQVFSRLNQGLEAVRAGRLKDGEVVLEEMRRADFRWRVRYAADVDRLGRLLTTADLPRSNALDVPVRVQESSITEVLKAPVVTSVPMSGKSLPESLGWSSFGDVVLDGTSVNLGPNGGIATVLAPGTRGYLVTAKGLGYLRLIPASEMVGSGLKGGFLVPLNLGKATVYIIKFMKDRIVLLNEFEKIQQSLPVSTAPAFFAVFSTDKAVLTVLPVPYAP